MISKIFKRMARVWMIFGPNESRPRQLKIETNRNERKKQKEEGKNGKNEGKTKKEKSNLTEAYSDGPLLHAYRAMHIATVKNVSKATKSWVRG